MKRAFNYIVPAVFYIAVCILVFICYYEYEWVAPEIAECVSVWTVVGVCVFFAAMYGAEVLLIRFCKKGWAIALCVLRYILLCVGIGYIFSNILAAMTFALVMLLFPVVGWVIAAVLLINIPLFVLLLLIMGIGIIAEPILLAFERNGKTTADLKNI